MTHKARGLTLHSHFIQVIYTEHRHTCFFVCFCCQVRSAVRKLWHRWQDHHSIRARVARAMSIPTSPSRLSFHSIKQSTSVWSKTHFIMKKNQEAGTLSVGNFVLMNIRSCEERKRHYKWRVLHKTDHSVSSRSFQRLCVCVIYSWRQLYVHGTIFSTKYIYKKQTQLVQFSNNWALTPLRSH